MLAAAGAGLLIWSQGTPRPVFSQPPPTAPIQTQDLQAAVADSDEVLAFIDEGLELEAVVAPNYTDTAALELPKPAKSGADSLTASPAPTVVVDDSPVERLVIPAMKLDTQVVEKPFTGTTWDISGLFDNVAWLQGTSLPGLGSNTVLAGHITVRHIGNGPFRRLDRLQPGDEVSAYTANRIYTFRVREQQLVKITDGYITLPSEQPQLTLITCSSWDENSDSYSRRLVVYADLVSVRSLVEGDANIME